MRIVVLCLVILFSILEVDVFADQHRVYLHFKKRFELCRQPAERGNCPFAYKAWYFNSDTKKCESFMYSRCGGNWNRFNSKIMCIENCMEFPDLFYD
ncbi:protease inhibitor-like [Drosophila serrata]|uniref:protease inhibitor-like n=1 Tax=Drosophila serrata TaxID=7274 RepID=UPI000A1D0789|nr:protease inhibitor-like [Drosophila serrata]